MHTNPNLMLSTSVYGFERDILQISALLKVGLQCVELAFENHQSEPKAIEFGELPKGGRRLRPVLGHHPYIMWDRLYW